MAKKSKAEETRTSIDELNDSLTSLGNKVQDNQKIIMIVTLCVVVVVAAVLIYIFMVRKPAIEKANNNIGDADRELLFNGNDSIAYQIYEDVAANGYDAGNRANLVLAIKNFKDKNYDEALNYLSDYSTKDQIVGSAAYSLKGDCYVNLDKLPEAVGAFKQAIKQSGDNPSLTPFYMMKLARVYQAQKNYAAEADIYKQILAEYPTYPSTYNINVEKALARAELRAANPAAE